MELVKYTNGKLVVSHVAVAEYTDNDFKALRQTIENNSKDFEEFGPLEFEIVKVSGSVGAGRRKVYYLNEQQAYLLMTYMRNNEIVRNFKKLLVKEFFEMREKQFPHAKRQTAILLKPDPYVHQIERENIELKRALNRLLIAPSQNDELQKLEYENRDLKRILVGIHNRYHEILTTCSPLAIQDELRKMTNLFQLINAGDGNDENLNMKTIAKHGYWR